MILSFTQKIDSKPNYFLAKIWESFHGLFTNAQYQDYRLSYLIKFNDGWDMEQGVLYLPKSHTIRRLRITKAGVNAAKQWKAGDIIHPVVNNRSTDYFQFAPAIKCTGVQEIEIRYRWIDKQGPVVWIDGKRFYDPYKAVDNGMAKLAMNDGFDSVEDFFTYFSEQFSGLIIHWTDLRY